MIVKSLLLARWNKNNERLEKDDVITALYCFSRELEHDSKFNENLYEYMKKNKKDTLEVLITLISEY